ncbi:MAG: 4Fe-4S cluster-binding domain-containing protein [Calditrichaeota bacterium]|nr:MAG: 4Fe-4S cluster-binding domain-containing protein [Calditrichota bacterium]
MFFSISKFLESSYAGRLSSHEIKELRLLTKVFPFKVSKYVLDELIDWDNRHSDPIYRLTFPQKEMLLPEHWEMLKAAKSFAEEKLAVQTIRKQLNPHPDGQVHNIPRIGDRLLGGLQHKYRETVLVFPAQGQTCHAYCTYCFRWAQFVNSGEHKFKTKEQKDLFDYLSLHKEVTDVLFTGGDPMWIPNQTLFDYFNVLLQPELNHVQSIRIGTKALAYHPERFLGEEGDALLKFFEKMIDQGKNIALMAHVSHWKELETNLVQQAIRRLINVGVQIRTQAPLIRGINDSAEVWRDMWKMQVRLGMIPYYMFIERDTGAQHYFSVPLGRAYQIFTEAYSQVSGLAKTVRGPSMSAWPGKVLIDGVVGQGETQRFLLKFIQCRNPQLINKPFYAKFDETATWLDDLELEPALKEALDEMEAEYEEQEVTGVA